jgi:hypothetical protein
LSPPICAGATSGGARRGTRCCSAAVTTRIERAVSVFDALEEFHRQRETTRGCAFLAAAVEVTDPQHPAQQWLAADTELLADRLQAFAAAHAPPTRTPSPPSSSCSTTAPLPLASVEPSPPGRPATPLPTRALATAAIARHRDSGRKAGLLTRAQTAARDEQA